MTTFWFIIEALVKDFYDESESGQKVLLEAQSNLNTYTKENTTLEFFNYSIKKVEIVNNNTYKVSYSQEYKNSSPNREPIYYYASATDTVIEKNGRFYITEFDGPKPQKLDSAEFKLND